MTNDIQADVVVVGGGPVGLLIAGELAGHGVRTVVVEAETAVSGRPKATTLHARAVQSLARRGHLGDLAGEGTGPDPVSRPFHFAGIPGLTISAPAMEPTPILKCPQEELERHFEQRARAAGAVILRGHRVTGVQQGPDGVRVTAQGPRGGISCVAAYLVGADGARSTVREQAGFESWTRTATVSAMAGDVRLENADALRPGWHRTARGWIVAKDAPHGRTHLRTLNCVSTHPARHLPLTLEELRREVSWIAGRDIAMREPQWLTRFSDFSRLVGCYRKGRILLAGDAAHLHFPIAGQGLSTGVLDALNLGWKLAFTVRGTAADGLLDTYDQERRPAARRVIDNTLAQLAIMRPGAELDPLRALFGELLASEPQSGVLASMLSAQDTVLPARGADSSPWEGRFLQNIALTTRDGHTDVIGLLGEGRPLLLLSGGQDSGGYGSGGYEAEARPWAGLLRVVRCEPVPELPYEAVLVRPDGYVGWAAGGGPLSLALRAYFGAGGGVRADGLRTGASGALSGVVR
ncbi:FAD-dependent monooxygenase [Streptomyces camelliae]|uniref:FAD-dependent monooxygenase n=1 Tax=Streptomyces camelliae TaxID=3004093 RepID=A0ABY7PG22_9ACTN|nr:FAD-dependent monooxygenase [Streptomyces sp. HUAS 2-6]WBO69590.1 FAD-dependent monooxygenase [Streptomyces sp. HUAS 2-6]